MDVVVFSATERERLHGHTHAVRVTITGPVADDGMIANYAVFKKRVRNLCEAWDEYYLIPGQSPYVNVREEGGRSRSRPRPAARSSVLDFGGYACYDALTWGRRDAQGVRDARWPDAGHFSNISSRFVNPFSPVCSPRAAGLAGDGLHGSARDKCDS